MACYSAEVMVQERECCLGLLMADEKVTLMAVPRV